MQVPSLFCFALCFFSSFKNQVSFGVSSLTNSQEPYLLPGLLLAPISSSWMCLFLTVTLLPSYSICLFTVFLLLDPMEQEFSNSLRNNNIAVYIFRCFHLFLGTILKKIVICTFGKACELRAHTKLNGVKVRNGTRRTRIFFLSFFSCSIHLVPEMQEFLLSDLVGRSHQKNTTVLLVFFCTKSFVWKLPVSAAFPHEGRISQHTTVQCGIKNLHKTFQQSWNNILQPLGSGTSTTTASGDLQPHSANAVKFAGFNQPREQVLTLSELKFSCRKKMQSSHKWNKTL